MIALHFITNTFPPDEGGLEKRLLRLVTHFSNIGFKVFVHICNSETDVNKYIPFLKSNNVEIRLLGAFQELLEVPHDPSLTSQRTRMDRFRLDYLVLRNLIAEEMNQYSKYKHIVISNFVTTCGYVAFNVCQELKIPHVVSLVGTDFSKGFRNPTERFLIEKVIDNASCVVALNGEYAKLINENWLQKKCFIIHGSVSVETWRKEWVSTYKLNTKSIRLFTDCGYSNKKGTQILLWAFEKLIKENYDMHLVICGKTNTKELSFWSHAKTKYKADFGERIKINDYLNEAELLEHFNNSHIYCYPTISEGCSNSRITALCKGIPIVTTYCGEIIDLASNTSHIKFCMPANHQQFYETLSATCDELINNKLQIDYVKINEWRTYLNVKREIAQWQEVIEFVTNE